MNSRARYPALVALALAVAAALYFALPFIAVVISLGEICPYSPVGVSMCRHDTRTKPEPQARVRTSTALRRLGTLAFVGYSTGGSASDIFVVNADGTGLRNVTTGERQGLLAPVWSPDRKEIALVGDHEYAHASRLGVLDLRTGRVREQTDNAGVDSNPAWSPDGARIAFESSYRDDPAGQTDVSSEIYVVRPGGSGTTPTKLTQNGRDNYEPSWSPDATMIAFSSVGAGNSEIYVMNADGSAQRNLSRNRASDDDPAWSPDGTEIAFASGRSGTSQIYVMGVDGSSVHQVTHRPGDTSKPVWSSDGRRIAFLDHDAHAIYVMRPDGTGARVVLTGADKDGGLAW